MTRRHKTPLAAAALLVALQLLGAPRASAETKGWQTAEVRRRTLVGIADKHRLPRASEQTLQRLRKQFPHLKNITADRVRIVSYQDPAYRAWAQEVGQQPIVGIAATPHTGGSHPHFLSYQPKAKGEIGNYAWIIDGIQPGWRNRDGSPATFRDGTRMRRQPLDKTHSGSARLLGLYLGPKDHVAAQGKIAYDQYVANRQCGFNCARYTTTNLSELGKRLQNDPNNPLKNVPVTGFGGAAFPGVTKAAVPDMIIHAVPGPVTTREVNGQRVASELHVIKERD